MNEIDDIIQRLRKAQYLIESKDGTKLDLVKEKIRTNGPFLHQDTENISEEESAKFERNNAELFNWFRELDGQLEGLF